MSHISRPNGRKSLNTPPSIKIHGNNNRQEFQRSVENINDDLPKSNAMYKSISNTNIHYDDSKLKQHADTSKLSNPSINTRRHSLTTNNRLTPNNRGIDRSLASSGLSPRGSIDNLNDSTSRFGIKKSNKTSKATLTVGTPVEQSRQFSRSTNDGKSLLLFIILNYICINFDIYYNIDCTVLVWVYRISFRHL